MRSLILVTAVVVAAILAACGPTASPGPVATATPTPGGMNEVQAALALRGVTIHEVVSGDAGCPSVRGLHSNAARFVVSLAGEQDQRYDVFLFRWRRPADFSAAEQSFSECIDEYTAGVTGDVPIDGLEVAPWRAYGPGWSEELLLVLKAALRDVRGS